MPIEPYKNFKFRVVWQGQTVARAGGFSDVSGLGQEVNYAERHSRKPMLNHWGDPHENLDGKTIIGGFKTVKGMDSKDTATLPRHGEPAGPVGFSHGVRAPRDLATGAATGKRQLVLDDLVFEASAAGFESWLKSGGGAAQRISIEEADRAGNIVRTKHYSVRSPGQGWLHGTGTVSGLTLEIV